MPGNSMAFLKGTVDVLILKTLSLGRLHGYGISRWIRERSGQALTLQEGALYPALRRLEKKGLVETEWGITDTNRDAKFYELTAAGRERLERELRDWGRYVKAMGSVLEAQAQD